MLKKKFLKIEKRLRFVISTFVITVIFLFSTFFFFDKAIFFVPLLILTSYFLTYFSILENIKKIEWLTLFLPQILFVIGLYFFYFLFPGRWLTRLPMLIFLAISYYAISLSSNIFNVGVEKSLQLYRPAFSISFLYQLITFFLFLQVIFSFHFSFLINALLVGLISFILAVYFFWIRDLQPTITKEMIKYGFFVALVIVEIATLFFFIPVNYSILSLFLVSNYYILTGLIHNYLNKSFYKETIREYLIVLVITSLMMLFSVQY